MNLSLHQIYAAATSTGGDNITSIMLPAKGKIVGVHLFHNTGVAAGVIRVELSLQSTSQFALNDARNVIVSLMKGQAEGASHADIHSGFVPTNVQITPMDKIYLHVSQASAAWRTLALIQFVS